MKSTMAAVRQAMKSEIDILHHTPLMPQKEGKISKSGMRYNTCRVRLRKMDILAMPILVKKLPATIW